MTRFWALLLVLWPLTATAQGVATLVADSLTVTDGRLTARGNVEAFFDGARLTAEAVTYDQSGDRLSIAGPIILTTAEGAILTADFAELDPQFQNGLLRGARLVLDQQLQLAAQQIDRAEGRMNQLYQVAATACQVCANRAPLWEIRATRVVHDEEAQQLYFTNPRFLIRGVPVFGLPRLRLPDPTLDRATGLLVPRFRNTDLLNAGLKLPYFITIGDSRDLLLTPYLSSETTTLELRYRQAFRSGMLTIDGAVSQDTLLPDETRAYLFAQGDFRLPRGFDLAFDVEAVSDNAYLLDYGYSEKDRLDSALSITRVTGDELIEGRFTYFESLREDEVNATLPPIVASLRYDRRVLLDSGGLLRLSADSDALVRYGDATGEDGRDLARLGAGVHWSQGWVLGAVAAEARAGLRADMHRVADDDRFETTTTRAQPSASLTLRYPLAGGTGQIRHLVEPVLALHWSNAFGGTPPNEDSTRPELDTGNLYALDQIPGEDATATGLRAALGATWTRSDAQGGASSLTFGRVYQREVSSSYSASSGLDSTWSDWLIAGQITLPRGLRFEGRSLLAKDLTPTLATARAGWATETLALDAAYIWQEADADRDRADPISEWSIDGRVQLTPAWAVSFDTRYDITTDQPASAGLGVEWKNECVTVDLSVSRRYTSSTTVDPSTDYGLSVALNGFSADGTSGPMGGCRN